MQGKFIYAPERWYPKRPAAVWPFVADTARMNELSGLKAYQVKETIDPHGRVLRHASGKVGPLTVRWEERFGEWELNSRLVQKRIFTNGPIIEALTVFELKPDGNGTRIIINAEVRWRGLLGRLLERTGALRKEFDQRFDVIDRLIKRADEVARVTGFTEEDQLEQRARERVDPLFKQLAEDPASHGLADALEDHLAHAPVGELRGMRPFALARLWGASQEHAVELCLAAHQAGILALGWDLLCPRCRGAKARVSKLDELPTGTHCGSCNIDYGRNFAANVELTFRPEPWLRPLPEGEFCLLGPASTPHVVLQSEIQPGGSASLRLTVPPGRYRYRTVEAGGEAEVEVGSDGTLPEFCARPEGIVVGAGGDGSSILLRNQTGKARFFVIENRDWTADSLTGERVIAMPAFRRLCPEQLLRPGDDVTIQRITIMFTDLQGSTRLYARLGDSSAYRLVRDHFAYLAERVQRHGGFIVKTVGDSVMAAFHDPAAATRAALSMQDDVAVFNQDRTDARIVLKVGLHAGACIAVTATDLLDYFGSTVNIAARLEHHCGGGEVLISAGLLADEAVCAVIDGRPQTDESTELRGVAEPVRYIRIKSPHVPERTEWSGVGRRRSDGGG